MKKLLATVFLFLLCVGLPAMLIQADPGDTAGTPSDTTTTTDTTWVNTVYGPPPPGYVGPWPPPDGTMSTTSDSGDEPPWTDPDN